MLGAWFCGPRLTVLFDAMFALRAFSSDFFNLRTPTLHTANPNQLNFHSIRCMHTYVHVHFCSRGIHNQQIALPTAPTDVIISEVAATSVRLEWSYKGPEDLQYYVIQYKPKNANQVSRA